MRIPSNQFKLEMSPYYFISVGGVTLKQTELVNQFKHNYDLHRINFLFKLRFHFNKKIKIQKLGFQQSIPLKHFKLLLTPIISSYTYILHNHFYNANIVILFTNFTD